MLIQFILEYNNHNFVLTGIWTAMPTLPSEGSWIHHMIIQYPGIVAFLLGDIIVLIACTTLTTAQASQVAIKLLLCVLMLVKE